MMYLYLYYITFQNYIEFKSILINKVYLYILLQENSPLISNFNHIKNINQYNDRFKY